MNNPLITSLTNINADLSLILFAKNLDTLDNALSEHLAEQEINFVKSKTEKDFPICINQYHRHVFIVLIPDESNNFRNSEILRVNGFTIYRFCKSQKINSVQILATEGNEIPVAEGLVMSSYDFIKYKTSGDEQHSFSVSVVNGDIKAIDELSNTMSALFFSRDIVNEPQSYLTAPQLSSELEQQCKNAGIEFTCFDLEKIKSLKMGGLIAVNQGSVTPATFNILEYKPSNAKNSNPLVLVGKGVVYDTGGLSLKPTAHSMDIMKCDMGGSATVSGALIAIAKNKLPYHVVVLIPATDNRPGGDAYAPGDVITMYNGSTVEVWNTDAEGRMVLADALAYAKQYKPELVIDVATLTGAAMRAIGKEATVMMGTASEEIKTKIKTAGSDTFERIVEFPLWDEYSETLESDIADIKNLGGPNAGAITAGKFLETFTDYPWMHLDIAAPAFLEKPDKYRGKNATGVGVRMIYNFVKKLSNE